jgi:hypothetical protein
LGLAQGVGSVEYAPARGVRIITENWQALAARPTHPLAILDALHGTVDLGADFGNARGPTREEDLRAILPRAVTIHAKTQRLAPGVIEVAAFLQCRALAHEAGFQSTYVLIFDDDPAPGYGS